jgi:hypothetical protein
MLAGVSNIFNLNDCGLNVACSHVVSMSVHTLRSLTAWVEQQGLGTRHPGMRRGPVPHFICSTAEGKPYRSFQGRLTEQLLLCVVNEGEGLERRYPSIHKIEGSNPRVPQRHSPAFQRYPIYYTLPKNFTCIPTVPPLLYSATMSPRALPPRLYSAKIFPRIPTLPPLFYSVKNSSYTVSPPLCPLSISPPLSPVDAKQAVSKDQ